MGIIAWVVLGGLAGWIASMIMGRNDQMGCITNVLVGIVGAFIGGLVMQLLGFEGITGFNIWSFIVALLGAVILLFLLGLVWGRRR